MTTTPSNSPLPLPNKRGRPVLFKLVAIGLLCLSVFIVWRISLAWKVRSRLEALHSEGYPTSMSELQQMYYPDVPPESNAATHFNAAFSRLTTMSTRDQSFLSRMARKLRQSSIPFTAQEDSNICVLIATNAAALELLHQIPDSGVCRYPLDFSRGYLTDLRNLTTVHPCAQLLALEANWHGTNGDLDGAVDDIEAELRVLDSLADEPFLICQLVRINSESLAVSSLERILNKHPFTDAQLARLAKDFQKVSRPEAMQRAVAGETCEGISFFRTPSQTAAAAPTPGPGDGDDASSDRASTGFNLLSLLGFMDHDFNFYLSTMSDYLAAGRMPFPERLDASKKIEADVASIPRSHLHLFSSLLLPSMNRAYRGECDMAARQNMIATVFALERYRLANQNQLPGKLQDLVPAYLDAVPVDPFDGKPLRYKQLPRGYLIYSVGEDGVDNGGTEWNEEKKTGDFTFAVGR